MKRLAKDLPANLHAMIADHMALSKILQSVPFINYIMNTGPQFTERDKNYRPNLHPYL